MFLDQYYPGMTPQKILDNMGFEVDVSRAEALSPPRRRSFISSGKSVIPSG